MPLSSSVCRQIAIHAGHAVSLVRVVVDAGIHESVEIIKAARGRQKSLQRAQIPLAVDAALVARRFQHPRQDDLAQVHAADSLERDVVFFGRVLVAVVGCLVADHVVDPVALRIASGQQRGARRRAGGPGDIKVRQPRSLARQAIERRRDDSVAENAQIVVALVVRNDQQDVRTVGGVSRNGKHASQ